MASTSGGGVLDGESQTTVYLAHLAIFFVSYAVQGLTTFGGGMFAHILTVLVAIIISGDSFVRSIPRTVVMLVLVANVVDVFFALRYAWQLRRARRGVSPYPGGSDRGESPDIPDSSDNNNGSSGSSGDGVPCAAEAVVGPNMRILSLLFVSATGGVLLGVLVLASATSESTQRTLAIALGTVFLVAGTTRAVLMWIKRGGKIENENADADGTDVSNGGPVVAAVKKAGGASGRSGKAHIAPLASILLVSPGEEESSIPAIPALASLPVGLGGDAKDLAKRIDHHSNCDDDGRSDAGDSVASVETIPAFEDTPRDDNPSPAAGDTRPGDGNDAPDGIVDPTGKKCAFRRSDPGVLFAGLSSGVLSGMLSVGGPPLIIMLTLLDLGKEEARATMICLHASLAPLRAVFTFAVAGMWYDSYAPLGAICVSSAAVGFLVGSLLVKRVNKDVIIMSLLVLLLASGVLMIATA